MEDVVGFKRKSNNCYLFTGYEWIRVKSYDQTMLYFYEAGLTNHMWDFFANGLYNASAWEGDNVRWI